MVLDNEINHRGEWGNSGVLGLESRAPTNTAHTLALLLILRGMITFLGNFSPCTHRGLLETMPLCLTEIRLSHVPQMLPPTSADSRISLFPPLKCPEVAHTLQKRCSQDTLLEGPHH